MSATLTPQRTIRYLPSPTPFPPPSATTIRLLARLQSQIRDLQTQNTELRERILVSQAVSQHLRDGQALTQPLGNEIIDEQYRALLERTSTRQIRCEGEIARNEAVVEVLVQRVREVEEAGKERLGLRSNVLKGISEDIGECRRAIRKLAEVEERKAERVGEQ